MAHIDLTKGFKPSDKEQITKNILSKLFSPSNPLLSKRDTDILSMLLIEDKELEEVSNKVGLTPFQISELFDKSVIRVNFRLEDFNEQLQTNIDNQLEIKFLKHRLMVLENAEKTNLFLPLDTKELLSKDLGEFNLSARVVNCCRAHDIDTLAGLVKISKHDFSKFLNLGKASVNEVTEFLLSKGLNWKMKI